MVDKCLTAVLHLRNRHFFVLDIVAFLLTPTIALILRKEHTTAVVTHYRSLLIITAVFLVVKLAVFGACGIYRLYWRYASAHELGQLVLAGMAAMLLQTLLFFWPLWQFGLIAAQFPRSVPLIDGLLVLVVLAYSRYSVPLADRMRHQGYDHGGAKRVLVVGAGQAGVKIVQEMQSNPQLGLVPSGFVDDAREKRQAKIQGVSVLGTCAQLPLLLRAHDIQLVIVTMPAAPGKVIRKIASVCERANVPTKIIPSINELLGSNVSIKQLRDVQIDDLLRRQPVHTDTSVVRGLLYGKRVMVTGAGGSIGSELCRQVLQCRPSELILLGHGENSIFTIHNELLRLIADAKAAGPGCQLHAAIADIRMPERLAAVFETYRPEIVLHAAAHKHVPLMELNPVEAITNNVLGTRNLLEAAITAEVERFVMISTDKAVNPTSIMGASKRVAELLVHQAAVFSGKPYVAVRFGNVLGSRGSVVLTFKQQIAAGGPVTVTHPDMQRFFMTIPEAVQLALQSATLGAGGEVFTLDMGELVKIVDLARDMIELSGLEVGRDIDILFTGMRPGEKLYEELFVVGEEFQRTVHEKIFIARNASSLVPLYLNEAIAMLEAAAERNDAAAIWRALRSLIPQLRPEVSQRGEPLTVAEPLRTRTVGVD